MKRHVHCDEGNEGVINNMVCIRRFVVSDGIIVRVNQLLQELGEKFGSMMLNAAKMEHMRKRI